MRLLSICGIFILLVLGTTSAASFDPNPEPRDVAAGMAVTEATPVSTDGTAQLTPLLDTVLAAPHWFTGTDGKVHLVYELLLINALSVPLTVSDVEVVDADSGAPLLHLSGEELLAAMSLATTPEAPAVELTPSSIGVAWIDVPLARAESVPAAVTHRLTVVPPPDVPIPESLLSFTGTKVVVDRRPPVVLGPPLIGPGWAALGSCCDGPHRRALLPIDGRWYLAQRFAIDFNQLDAENRPGVGDPLLPTSFPTFGQPVLAVADGMVVEAVDRYLDLGVGEAREDITLENAGGNRIVLDLGDGRFAIYAHLRAGTVSVQAGQRVNKGDQIAAAGSSGTSGGPHLHFQVTDRPSVIAGDGLPYVFDAFELTGQTPPLAEVFPYYESLLPIPIARERTGPRHDELPLGRDVVTFPSSQIAAAVGGPGGVARLVDIGGGRRMYLECRGAGGPTVILEAGAGNNGSSWDTISLPPDSNQMAVLPGVATFTRVCVYDRPGTIGDIDPTLNTDGPYFTPSRSDPAPMPRTAEDAVADLHALLDAANVPGPYMLAGHSFGGLIDRLYASTYPDEVVGLVLVDAAHEDWYGQIQALLTPEQWQAAQEPPAELASYEEREQLDTDASARQMRDGAVASPLRPMPLVVITHGQSWPWPAEYPADAIEALWPPLQQALSELAPDGRLVVAEESGHDIYAQQPQLVIDAIHDVVDAVREAQRQAE